MEGTKILIVDDEPIVHETLGVYLRAEGFVPVSAYDGETGLAAITEDIALCVLDVMLPRRSGIDLCREIRKNSTLPIIFLSARCEEIDKIIAMEIGADDYIVKPFSAREVTARIKAVLRRSSHRQIVQGRVVSIGGLVVDIGHYFVTLHGVKLAFTPKEMEILYMLAASPGQVFTRAQLLSRIWGYEFTGETRTVDTHIKRIRTKICHPEFYWEIKTLYGVGYKFDKK